MLSKETKKSRVSKSLRFIQSFRDHTGVMRRYFLRRGLPRVALPGEPGSRKFMAVYNAALARIPPPSRRGPAPKQKIEQALKGSLVRALQRAGAMGWDFNLDIEWCLQRVKEQEFRCTLTGIPFFFRTDVELRNPYTPSLDRIDCKRGYTKDNVRIVIHAINFMRSNWDLDVVEHVMREFLKHKGSVRMRRAA